MYCNNCGKESPYSVRFCPECGQPYEMSEPTLAISHFEDTPTQQNQDQPFDTNYPPIYEQFSQQTFYQPVEQNPQPSGNKNKILLITLIVVMTLVAVLGSFVALELAEVTEFTGWFENDDEEFVEEDDDEFLEDTEETEDKSDKHFSALNEEQLSAFYGVWCIACKDISNAEKMVLELSDNGFEAQVFVTTDWENLNSEKFYVVTAGVCETKREAEKLLTKVKESGYTDAYVRYTGERK